MSQTLKLVLVGSICLLVGAGAVLAWSSYTKTQQENAELKAQVAASKNIAEKAQETVQEQPKGSAAPSTSPKAEIKTGAITGTLGYPSQGIPPLEVYAFKADDTSFFVKTTTQLNQTSFTLSDVVPGTYLVVAYPADTDQLAGGYTKAVACGLSVECTDHSLVPVVVSAGETQTGIEIKDWYAPAGQFPAKPKE